MTVAFIGLGSNLGDRESFIARAVAHIKAVPDVKLKANSPLYESPALLKHDAPEDWNIPFLNAVVAVETGLMPHTLLEVLKEIEFGLGRQDRGRWAPREIDCDLLAYGDHVFTSDELTLPHPAMLERDFVLLPWRDIAPDWLYPVPNEFQGKTIARLCERLENVTAQKVTQSAA